MHISKSLLALGFTTIACSSSDGKPAGANGGAPNAASAGSAMGANVGTNASTSIGGSSSGTSANASRGGALNAGSTTAVGGAVSSAAAASRGGSGTSGSTTSSWVSSGGTNAGGTNAGGTNAGGTNAGGTNAGGASSSSAPRGGSSVGGAGNGGNSGNRAGASGSVSFNLGGALGVAGQAAAAFPFPQNAYGKYCNYPTHADPERVRAAYDAWYRATITSDGAGGFLRVKKPDSGSVIGSTVSEGIGYGMLLAVYMNDPTLFDQLFKYEQSHTNAHGLMDWEIGPDNQVTSGGRGAATDGDEDIAWSLIMADRQWGGKGSLDKPYLDYAKQLIDAIWTYEVDPTRGYLLKPGDAWGNVDVTNPSYFAPAYFRVFGQVTGKVEDWNHVIAGNYDILERSLNATSGNQDNGLVPAWCDSSGKPVVAFSGAPTHFQNDSTRTPFRVGQDYCYFGEPRAQAYLAKISQFYVGIGVSAIVDGYNLDGTPRPERAVNGAQAASFVGPAAVSAMSDTKYQSFVDQAYTAVATLNLNAGTIYYQKSWTALSLLMLTGNFVDFTQLPAK